VTVTYYTKGYTQFMHSIYVKKLKLDENLHKHRSFCLLSCYFCSFCVTFCKTTDVTNSPNHQHKKETSWHSSLGLPHYASKISCRTDRKRAKTYLADHMWRFRSTLNITCFLTFHLLNYTFYQFKSEIYVNKQDFNIKSLN
jgi:hypothetical protein